MPRLLFAQVNTIKTLFLGFWLGKLAFIVLCFLLFAAICGLAALEQFQGSLTGARLVLIVE